MTLHDYHKYTVGASDHLTRCRALWGGGELFNDYFSRLPEHAQEIEIRGARYDEKHDVVTVYTTWKGYDEYRHAERRKQHGEGKYNKYGSKERR